MQPAQSPVSDKPFEITFSSLTDSTPRQLPFNPSRPPAEPLRFLILGDSKTGVSRFAGGLSRGYADDEDFQRYGIFCGLGRIFTKKKMECGIR